MACSRFACTSEGLSCLLDSRMLISTREYSRSTKRCNAASSGRTGKRSVEAATNTPALLQTNYFDCVIRSQYGSLAAKGLPWQQEQAEAPTPAFARRLRRQRMNARIVRRRRGAFGAFGSATESRAPALAAFSTRHARRSQAISCGQLAAQLNNEPLSAESHRTRKWTLLRAPRLRRNTRPRPSVQRTLPRRAVPGGRLAG